MKDPKFALRVAGRDCLIPNNRGVATLIALMAEAIPVDADLHLSPPVITLEYDGRPEIADFLQEVRCVKIPRGVRWLRKAADGAVQEVRPVTRSSQQLAKAVARELLRLNGGKNPTQPKGKPKALTNGGGGAQLSLGWTE